MRISTKGDYGVRALIELAHHYGEGPMQSAEIAAAPAHPGAVPGPAPDDAAQGRLHPQRPRPAGRPRADPRPEEIRAERGDPRARGLALARRPTSHDEGYQCRAAARGLARRSKRPRSRSSTASPSPTSPSASCEYDRVGGRYVI